MPEDEAESLTNEIDKPCQFSDQISNILVKIKSIFLNSYVENSLVHTNSIAVSSVLSNQSDSHVKFPKLTLVKCNKEMLSWQSFWDQYYVAI